MEQKQIDYQKVRAILAKLNGDDVGLIESGTQKTPSQTKQADNKPLNLRVTAFMDNVKRGNDRKQRVFRIYNLLKNQYHGSKK